MATYCVTYKTTPPINEYVDEVTCASEAIMLADSLHPEMPRNIEVETKLICE